MNIGTHNSEDHYRVERQMGRIVPMLTLSDRKGNQTYLPYSLLTKGRFEAGRIMLQYPFIRVEIKGANLHELSEKIAQQRVLEIREIASSVKASDRFNCCVYSITIHSELD